MSCEQVSNVYEVGLVSTSSANSRHPAPWTTNKKPFFSCDKHCFLGGSPTGICYLNLIVSALYVCALQLLL